MGDIAKFGSYGTFLFPEIKGKGYWRLQTDFEPLLKVMKKRGLDSKSPWETIGWGTSFIFRREFLGTHEAKRSVERIFTKIGLPEIGFVRLESGGFDIVTKAEPIPEHQRTNKKTVSRAKSPKTPPLTYENGACGSVATEQIGGGSQ